MFTGLVAGIGHISKLEKTTTQANVWITLPPNFEPLTVGDSIAVDGACVTVVFEANPTPNTILVQVSLETLSKTRFGHYTKGSFINLELALRASDRLGGHWVTGHVDGLGTLANVETQADFWNITVALPPNAPELAKHVVTKGSIAVNGTSLTINTVQAATAQGPAQVGITIIPHTWANTTLQHLAVGEAVNIETDLLGKYAAQLLGGYVR